MNTEKNNLIALYSSLTEVELDKIKAKGNLTEIAQQAIGEVLATKDLAQSRKEKHLEENFEVLKLAPLTSRFVAKLIDVILLNSAYWSIYIMFGFKTESTFLVFLFLLVFVLGDTFFKGQSFGKRIMSITVIDRNDNSYCSRWQSFLRNTLLILGILDIGFIFGKNKQRLGDIAAQTIVVNDRFLSGN